MVAGTSIDGLRGGTGLAAALHMATGPLHARAERSGMVRAMLRGTATRHGYAMVLRTLLPAYQELEAGLDRHRDSLAGIARPELYRAPAMVSDLVALAGRDWPDRLPLLPAGRRYAHRVRRAARGDGGALLAHAYVRYMGDLSGGQMLARRLASTLALGADMLAFTRFADLGHLDQAKADLRAAFDRFGAAGDDRRAVLREAQIAFRLNIYVAEAVADAVPATH